MIGFRRKKRSVTPMERAGAMLAQAYRQTGVPEQHLHDVLDAAERGDQMARAALAQDCRRLAARCTASEDIATLRALADAMERAPRH